MWTGNYALKLDSADTVMILTSRMMMWFLFSQHVPHITDVSDLDQGLVKIELCKSSILMVLYVVFGFDRNLSRLFGFG